MRLREFGDCPDTADALIATVIAGFCLISRRDWGIAFLFRIYKGLNARDERKGALRDTVNVVLNVASDAVDCVIKTLVGKHLLRLSRQNIRFSSTRLLSNTELNSAIVQFDFMIQPCSWLTAISQ